jgi:cell division protein ZapA (FtsZ GTPase activity inhibitor)
MWSSAGPDVTENKVRALADELDARLAALAESDPMAALRAAAFVEALAARTARQAAAAARRERRTGPKLGWLSVTKQAAHHRFAKHVRISPA